MLNIFGLSILLKKQDYKMKSKKGVISVQFNWIFILIIGVLILLFFGSFVVKLKNNSDITIANTIITNMQTIMTGAEVSTKTITPIKIPDREIRFSCDFISVGDIEKEITKNKIVFSPESIKGRTLLTWALDWNTPYHVSNFLCLTTPNYKYIFINSGDAQELYNSLPSKITKDIVKPDDISSIKDTGNYLKFVFFNNPKPEDVTLSSSIKSVSDKEVSAINVISGTNEIEFYEKKGAKFKLSGTAGYLGDPMILGAMFSGNLVDYKCNVEKAFNKLSIVSMIYEKRTEYLQDLYVGRSCRSYYDSSIFSDIIIDSKREINTDSIQSIERDIIHLKLNNEHLQSYSCPTMY